MPEKARLSVQKNKKGGFSGFLTFESGKKMPLPAHFVVGPEHDGRECEVERDRNGQVVRVVVEGKELPHKGEGKSAGGKRPAHEGQKETAGKGARLVLPDGIFLPRQTAEVIHGQTIENFGFFLEKGASYDEKKGAFRFSLPGKRVVFDPPLIPDRSFLSCWMSAAGRQSEVPGLSSEE